MAAMGTSQADISNIAFGIIQAKRNPCYKAGIGYTEMVVMTSDQKVNLFIISNGDEGYSGSHAVYLSKHGVRSRTRSKDGAFDQSTT
jgi:hypothetical protein